MCVGGVPIRRTAYRVLLGLYLVVFSIYSTTASAFDIPVWQFNTSEVQMSGFVVIRDSERTLTSQGLFLGQLPGQSQVQVSEQVQLGLTSDRVWVVFDLAGSGNGDPVSSWYLRLNNPLLDHACLFLAGPDGERYEHCSGLGIRMSQRALKHRDVVFPLTLHPGHSYRAILMLEGETPLRLTPELLPSETFQKSELWESVWLAAYVTLMVAMLIYNLVILVIVRDRIYLFYLASVFLLHTLAILAGEGVLSLFLWGEYVEISRRAFTFLSSMGVVSSALFGHSYMDLGTGQPRTHALIRGLCLALGVVSLIGALFFNQTTFAANGLAIGIVAIIIMGIAVRQAWEGNRQARVFVIAWSLLVASGLTNVLMALGWIQENMFSRYGVLWGSAVEVLLLAIALAYRINHLRRQRDIAQAKNFEAALGASIRGARGEHQSNGRSILIVSSGDNGLYRQLKDLIPEGLFRLETLPQGILNSEWLHENGVPDLLMIDCGVLRESGDAAVELCQALRKIYLGNDLPIMLVADRSISNLLIEGLRAGASDVLLRPFQPEELIARIENQIKVKGLALQLQQRNSEVLHAARLATLGEMSAGLAHEVNNPLQNIQGYLELLQETLEKFSPPALEKIQGHLKEIRHGHGRIRHITRSLLDYSRQTGGDKAEIPIHDIVMRACQFMRLQLQGHGVRLRVALSAGEPLIYGNASQIEQVFVNLLANSRDATAASGGEVTVSSYQAGDFVVIEVRDTGAGIAPENLDKIFDPFFTTKPQGEGTGLGLPISARIVRDHDGTIEVESETGKGSVFRLRFPKVISEMETLLKTG